MTTEVGVENSGPVGQSVCLLGIEHVPSYRGVEKRQLGMGFGDVVDRGTTTVEIVGLVGFSLELVYKCWAIAGTIIKSPHKKGDLRRDRLV